MVGGMPSAIQPHCSRFRTRKASFRIDAHVARSPFMTALGVVFRYGMPPGPKHMRALDSVREVYGIRRIQFDEQERTVRVEYDATRLDESTVASLLRRTGLDITDKLQLI